MERLEKWGWVVAIVTGVSALVGFNLRDLQPAVYGTLFNVAFYPFIIAYLITFFRSMHKSWYSAPELIGSWWRIALIYSFGFSLVGVLVMIVALLSSISLLWLPGAGIYVIAQVCFLMCVTKQRHPHSSRILASRARTRETRFDD